MCCEKYTQMLIKENIITIHFESLIAGVSNHTLTNDERITVARLVLLVLDSSPKTMRKLVNSRNKASTTESIRYKYREYVRRQENDRKYKIRNVTYMPYPTRQCARVAKSSSKVLIHTRGVCCTT